MSQDRLSVSLRVDQWDALLRAATYAKSQAGLPGPAAIDSQCRGHFLNALDAATEAINEAIDSQEASP